MPSTDFIHLFAKQADDIDEIVEEAVEEDAATNDKWVDPGEAAAAGLVASTGIAAKAIPWIANIAAGLMSPERVRWYGTDIRDMKNISSGIPGVVERAGDASDLAWLDIKTKDKAKILELFNVKPSDPNIRHSQKLFSTFFPRHPGASITTTADDIILTPAGGYPVKGSSNFQSADDIAKGVRQRIPLVRPDGKIIEPFIDIDAIKKFDQGTVESIDSMIQKYKLSDKGVKMRLTRGPLSGVLGPRYDPALKEVVLPWVNEAFVAHELGHAAHLTKPGAASLHAARKALFGGSLLGIPMAYLVGNELKEMFPGTVDDKAIDFVQRHAPAIVTATYAGSHLYPEVQATARAISHINKVKGKAAAKQALKHLIPALGTYVAPLVPLAIGASLAKKYFFEAEGKNKKLQKESGWKDMTSNLWTRFGPLLSEPAHIASQVARQSGELFKRDPDEIIKRLYRAGIDNIKSPHFVGGAIGAGIPAAALSYIHHNTPHGKLFEEKKRTIREQGADPIGKLNIEIEREEAKQNENDFTLPLITGLGAAISGGFLRKMFTDLMKVL